MRALLQRALNASVRVDGATVGEIEHGLVVLLGVTHGDERSDAEYLTAKTLGLRIFRDESGRMNRSLRDAAGSVLLISQFTLYGDTRKGRRPGFDRAADPATARELYETTADLLAQEVHVATGVFGAYMQVTLTNDGPVTFLLDSRDR